MEDLLSRLPSHAARLARKYRAAIEQSGRASSHGNASLAFRRFVEDIQAAFDEQWKELAPARMAGSAELGSGV